jgi:hypothetical protein
MDPRHDYERDGFLVLDGFVNHATCDALVARAGELVTRCGSSSRTTRLQPTDHCSIRSAGWFA